MKRMLVHFMVPVLFLTGCGGVAKAYDPESPASHHAQRKYQEAKKNGAAPSLEKGSENKDQK